MGSVISYCALGNYVTRSLSSEQAPSQKTTATRHWLAFHHISCHGSSQWWTPPLGSSFHLLSSTTSPRSCVSSTGWRLRSGLLSNVQSSCTSVFTDLPLSYLIDELCRVADVEARQRLRSNLSSSLIISRTRVSTVADRAFPVVAASVWNTLPEHATFAPFVAVFQSSLKTHLFYIFYFTLLWLNTTVSAQWCSCYCGHSNRLFLLLTYVFLARTFWPSVFESLWKHFTSHSLQRDTEHFYLSHDWSTAAEVNSRHKIDVQLLQRKNDWRKKCF